MKIKSYYTRTVEEAMAAARAEFGPEAMLLNSRKAPIQSRHLGEYEVVFASLADGEEIPAAQPVGAPAPIAPDRKDIFGERLSAEVADMKKELEGMRRALTRTAYAPPQWAGVSQDVSDAYAALTAAEVTPELAREIVQAASSRLSPARLAAMQPPTVADAGGLQRAVAQELCNRFKTVQTLGTTSGSPRIVALVGPPGSGKTTTLVKLAVNYGLAARKGVLLLSMDTNRVAAAEQLRSYASILGVGFHIADTVTSVAQTIEENRNKELIFIDTPGLGFAELEESTGLALFLSTRTDIDTHLVLPASMKPADARRMACAFEVLGPKRLLFTKLDETESYGAIFNEAALTKKPLSFFTTGQRIPEDLEAVTPQRVLDLLQGGGGVAKAKAA